MTGTRPDGNRYESALERDFMTLVEGDPDFESYLAQPIWIDYLNPLTGKTSSYPPDGLVRWQSARPPLLVEIKYREDCAGLWRMLRAKFRAAKLKADEFGWEFQVITEELIRGPRLFNVRFLAGYKARTLDQKVSEAIFLHLGGARCEIGALSQQLGIPPMDPQAVIASCWTMVAQGRLAMDWEIKVSARTLVWARG